VEEWTDREGEKHCGERDEKGKEVRSRSTSKIRTAEVDFAV
jgi:hypothetical protein